MNRVGGYHEVLEFVGRFGQPYGISCSDDVSVVGLEIERKWRRGGVGGEGRRHGAHDDGNQIAGRGRSSAGDLALVAAWGVVEVFSVSSLCRGYGLGAL